MDDACARDLFDHESSELLVAFAAETIVFVGRTAELYLGEPAAAFVGRPADTLVATDDLDHLERLAATDETTPLRHELIGVDGDRRWVETLVRRRTHAGQQVLLCLCRDVQIEIDTLARALAAERELARYRNELALMDDELGLPNRRAAESTLVRELSRSHRGAADVGVVLLAFEGHAEGDPNSLVELAAALIEGLRGIDVLARYGPDTLLAIVTDVAPPQLHRVAERLRQIAAGCGFEVSGGLAQANFEDTAASLLERAERACDHALDHDPGRVLDASEVARKGAA